MGSFFSLLANQGVVLYAIMPTSDPVLCLLRHEWYDPETCIELRLKVAPIDLVQKWTAELDLLAQVRETAAELWEGFVHLAADSELDSTKIRHAQPWAVSAPL